MCEFPVVGQHVRGTGLAQRRRAGALGDADEGEAEIAGGAEIPDAVAEGDDAREAFDPMAGFGAIDGGFDDLLAALELVAEGARPAIGFDADPASLRKPASARRFELSDDAGDHAAACVVNRRARSPGRRVSPDVLQSI